MHPQCHSRREDLAQRVREALAREVRPLLEELLLLARAEARRGAGARPRHGRSCSGESQAVHGKPGAFGSVVW